MPKTPSIFRGMDTHDMYLFIIISKNSNFISIKVDSLCLQFFVWKGWDQVLTCGFLYFSKESKHESDSGL